MARHAEHRRNALLAIAAALVGLVAFNTLLAYAMPRARLDLTQDQLYTLSPGARALLARLDEPVRLDYYWTKATGGDAPQVRAHAQRVGEFLDELQRLSNGMLIVRTIDPVPFSEAEDEARAAGLPGLTVDGSGRTLTLGLVVRGPTDRRAVLAYLSPEQEPFLEYEVLRAIAEVGRPDRPTVGIVAGMPLNGGMDPSMQGPPRGPPAVIEQFRALFNVEMIEPTALELPAHMTALMVVQPRKLSPELLRAIDAWAVAGRPLVVLADPYAETDSGPDARAMGAKRGGTSHDFGALLASWGVEIVPDMVVGDRVHATRVQTRAPGGGTRDLAYPAWLTLTGDSFAKDDPIIGSLNQLNVMSAGAIRTLPGATTTLTPLVQTSLESQLIQTLKLGFFGDPEQLIRDFKSDNERKVLAARITGPIMSAFAHQGAAADAAPTESTRAGKANILLVADADLISDETWLIDDRSGGVAGGKRPISDNGPFLVNAVELMAGDPALANVRGRGSYRRPFAVVEELRRAAEAKSVARERDLQDEIRRTELRIGELQRERTPDGGQALVLTQQQADELARLRQQMVDARKELRQVQHRLRENVEALGMRLLMLNAVAWPLCVSALALAWYMLRGRGSRKEHTT
ncbi:MAG: Gldg family protein [Phycisphaerae bacterium]|nr:Gldg family protein [Phycisphaerae bacterium]